MYWNGDDLRPKEPDESITSYPWTDNPDTTPLFRPAIIRVTGHYLTDDHIAICQACQKEVWKWRLAMKMEYHEN